MRFSCVIPCWNQAQYLPEAIDSALSQTVPFAEIIVVNDGSPDNTKEVAEKFPVKLINQVNKGLSSARNTGIMNSTGDYVLFLDSDDYLVSECVERMTQKALETDADVISGSFRAFGARSGDVILMPNPTLNDFKVGNRVGSSSAVKRSVLLECGGYSPRMEKGYEDFHLWFDLLARGKKFATIQEILWFYRTKENSMYTDSVKHHDDLMAQIYKDVPAAR